MVGFVLKSDMADDRDCRQIIDYLSHSLPEAQNMVTSSCPQELQSFCCKLSSFFQLPCTVLAFIIDMTSNLGKKNHLRSFSRSCIIVPFAPLWLCTFPLFLHYPRIFSKIKVKREKKVKKINTVDLLYK